ncbi:hypothetical protein Tco_1301575 [Tanacetum coccineum]
MLKVAKLSEEPEQSLLPPSREVNAEESADKSQSGTNVQPLSQPKAPTAMKSKKQKIPSSTQPKVSKDSREMNPPTTTHLQATEELVVIVVPIQSLEASVTAEVQDNQPKAADTTEATVPEKIVESKEIAKEQSLEFPTVEQLLDEVDSQNKVVQNTSESPYDTESEIKDFDSDLQSIHDDELRSVSGFEAADSDDFLDDEVSHYNHIVRDDIASAKLLSLPDHMDHICEEVRSLHSKLGEMESSIADINQSANIVQQKLSKQ